ncbi:MAG: anti-sigma factor [Acidimicrobiales bacterium]
MSERWPPEIEELLAVYALDAVDDDERAIVDDYLRENPRAVAEVESYREALSYLHAGAAAPAGVWERIASELESAPPPLQLDAFRPPATAPVRHPLGRILAIAAAVIALVAAGGVIVHQQREIDRRGSDSVASAIEREASTAQQNPQSRTVLLRDSGGALSVAAYVEPDGDLFLDGARLPVLDRDRTYQLWCVRDNDSEAISLAVLGSAPSTTKLNLDSCHGLLAITNETAGGVGQSDNDPVVAGRYV